MERPPVPLSVVKSPPCSHSNALSSQGIARRFSKQKAPIKRAAVARARKLSQTPQRVHLVHEAGDDPVEPGALVALPRRLLRQLHEVLGRLRHDILLQLRCRTQAVTNNF